jgi:putative nucleotidyltransferase with HDIG domain
VNILLVDDEVRVLEALERLLFSHGAEAWTVLTAGGAAEALQVMAATPIDVIVSDMRMPGMSGAELLERTKAAWPSVARIVLSGHTEQLAALRVAGVAHQFLDKPCDASRLIGTLAGIERLRSRIGGDLFQRLLGRLGALPAAPSTLGELARVTRDPTASSEQINAVVRRDPALVAGVLRLVSSSFFARASAPPSLDGAIRRLGVQVVQAIALELAATVDGDRGAEGRRHHAYAVGALAEAVVPAAHREHAFVAAILHDVGLSLMGRFEPALAQRAACIAAEEGRPLPEVEIEVVGVSHGDLGAYLLALWGLPPAVTDAVALHHGPFDVGASPATAAVQVAEALLDGGDAPPTAVAVLGHGAVPAAWQDRARHLRTT